MSKKEMEDKKRENTKKDTETHEKTVIPCPVCGNLLGEDNLPDIGGVIEERLCSEKDMRIVCELSIQK